MKISDPLGKVYSHTMFRRRSYDMHEEHDAANTSPTRNPSPPPPLPPHTNRRGYFDAQSRSRSRDRVVEEEEEDDESVVSDRSDDSLSTKSSRIVGGGSRRLGLRRSQRGMSSVRVRSHTRFGSSDFAERCNFNRNPSIFSNRHRWRQRQYVMFSCLCKHPLREKFIQLCCVYIGKGGMIMLVTMTCDSDTLVLALATLGGTT